MCAARPVLDLLDRFQPRDEGEAADVTRVRELVEATDDPWTRANPLHITASALIVHPPTGRVLLRWHQRQQAWLQVGGHGDPDAARPETPGNPLRWLPVAEAIDATTEANLRALLVRVQELFARS